MTTPRGRRAPARRGAWGSSAGVLGLLGSVTCAISMVLAALGVGTAAATSSMATMSGMGAGAPSGILGTFLRIGPWLLGVSVLLVTAAFALTRRPIAAVPALLAGAVLYASMYAQPNLAVMYAGIAIGYAAWLGLCLWLRGARRSTPTPRPPTTEEANQEQKEITNGEHPSGRG